MTNEKQLLYAYVYLEDIGNLFYSTDIEDLIEWEEVFVPLKDQIAIGNFDEYVEKPSIYTKKIIGRVNSTSSLLPEEKLYLRKMIRNRIIINRILMRGKAARVEAYLNMIEDDDFC